MQIFRKLPKVFGYALVVVLVSVFRMGGTSVQVAHAKDCYVELCYGQPGGEPYWNCYIFGSVICSPVCDYICT